MDAEYCSGAELASWAATWPTPGSDVAVERAVAALVDVTACMVAGYRSPSTMSVQDYAGKAFGHGNSPVLGQGLSLTAPGAALVNGAAAHALDFDDNFRPAITHASAVLYPALLAVGCCRPTSGQQLIDAYMIGLELQTQIAHFVIPHHYEQGWHATSTIGAIGAAGAVCLLIGGNAEQITHAMSIAFSLAAGSKLQFGSGTKPVHAGFAAHNAVLAAELAMAGLDANPNFLESKWGIPGLYQNQPSPLAPHRFERIKGLWAIDEFGLLPKRFPCCGAAHKALDAVEIFYKEYQITSGNLEEIEVWLSETAYGNLRFDNPTSESEARFSFAYPAACLITSGLLSLSHFSSEAVKEADVQRILPRFKRHIGENNHSLNEPVTVRARLKSGEEFSITVEDVRGSVQNPFSDQEIQNKINDCLRWGGKEDKAPLFKDLKDIQNLPDIGAVFSRF